MVIMWKNFVSTRWCFLLHIGRHNEFDLNDRVILRQWIIFDAGMISLSLRQYSRDKENLEPTGKTDQELDFCCTLEFTHKKSYLNKNYIKC